MEAYLSILIELEMKTEILKREATQKQIQHAMKHIMVSQVVVEVTPLILTGLTLI